MPRHVDDFSGISCAFREILRESHCPLCVVHPSSWRVVSLSYHYRSLSRPSDHEGTMRWIHHFLRTDARLEDALQRTHCFKRHGVNPIFERACAKEEEFMGVHVRAQRERFEPFIE